MRLEKMYCQAFKKEKLSLKYITYLAATKSLEIDRVICFNKSKSYFGFHTNINSGNLAVVAWIEYLD